VHNAGDSESGRFNLITGTWFSVNTFYAQLEQRVGLCQAVKVAQSMGVRMGDGSRVPDIYPAFVLGAIGSGFSALDTAGAYATIAAHGTYCTPLVITKVTDRNHHDVPVPGSDCSQVVDPGLADTVTQILHGVLTQRGATATGVGEPGRPAAAKTGTAENYSASDFAGFVPQMAAAVWVGNPHRPNQSLAGQSIGGHVYGQVFGATIAGPIWRDTMEAALKGVPVEPLPLADRKYIVGKQTTVPDVGGLSPADAVSTLQQAGFRVVAASTAVDSLYPAGTVAGSVPGAGSQAPPGSTVVIELSNGIPPPPSPSVTTVTPSPQPPPPSQQPSTPPGKKPHHGPH
jgi:membrane peptidoglycan carboxypeptidase